MGEDTMEGVERATLRTLAERISGGEAEDLASQLPAELHDSLGRPGEEAEAFGVDEFVARAAERGKVDPDEARPGAAAVLITVREAVTQESSTTSCRSCRRSTGSWWDRCPDRRRQNEFAALVRCSEDVVFLSPAAFVTFRGFVIPPYQPFVDFLVGHRPAVR